MSESIEDWEREVLMFYADDPRIVRGAGATGKFKGGAALHAATEFLVKNGYLNHKLEVTHKGRVELSK